MGFFWGNKEVWENLENKRRVFILVQSRVEWYKSLLYLTTVGNSGFYLKEIRGLAVIFSSTLSSACRGKDAREKMSHRGNALEKGLLSR